MRRSRRGIAGEFRANPEGTGVLTQNPLDFSRGSATMGVGFETLKAFELFESLGDRRSCLNIVLFRVLNERK